MRFFNKDKKYIGFLLVAVFLTSFGINGYAQKQGLQRIVNLKGTWKFSIGDRPEWISMNYSDDDWATIYVPSPWEEEGFHGYNGFGFYRRKFTISGDHKDRMLYLRLGYIDDVDEVYINGIKIGSSGSFPPKFTTAYNADRTYYIPENVLNFDGKNLIAIKVYDSHSQGGIVRGSVGIYTNTYGVAPEIQLQGVWKFRLKDNMQWAQPNYNDSDWEEIIVPGRWEDQGYRNYDGYAWYRKTFVYSGNITDESVIMMAGKIDDVDEVYLNGVLIGRTGTEMNGHLKYNNGYNNEYLALRGYYFDRSLLKKNQKNTIAIRVYDCRQVGGIYEGPVGIISQKKYIEYWRNRKQSSKKH